MTTTEFNFNIVLLSFGVCFIGIYMCVCSAEQFRGVFLKYGKPSFLQKFPWLSAIGINVTIVALWGMHYISMSGLIIRDNEGNIVPIRFNIGISLLSLFLGFLFKITGVLIACGDRFYAKSKAEILEFFVAERSVEEILSYSEAHVTYLLISKELKQSSMGGTCTAIGIILVHFVNMEAIVFPGYITYNGGIIFAVIVFNFCSILVGYWLFFRLLSIFPNVEFFRYLASLCGAIAICSVHYICLMGTTFHVDYSRSSQSTWKTGTMSQKDALYPVLLVSMIVLWLFVMLIFAELRGKINAYRSHIQRLSPNEKMSDLLCMAENAFNTNEATNRHVEDGKGQGFKKSAVVPDDESVL